MRKGRSTIKGAPALTIRPRQALGEGTGSPKRRRPPAETPAASQCVEEYDVENEVVSLRGRVAALEAENERLRQTATGEPAAEESLRVELEEARRRVAAAEEENFDWQAQLATNEAEKTYEIERGLETLRAELRFKTEELATAQQSVARLRGRGRSSAGGATAEDRGRAAAHAVLEVAFRGDAPPSAQNAVAALGKALTPARVREAATTALFSFVADDACDLAEDLVAALLPLRWATNDESPWPREVFEQAKRKIARHKWQHLKVAAALAREVPADAIAPLLVAKLDPDSPETSVCVEILVYQASEPLLECALDLLRVAIQSLDVVETDLFPEVAKAVAAAAKRERSCRRARRVVETAIELASTLAIRDHDLALRVVAGKPARAFLEYANDALDDDDDDDDVNNGGSEAAASVLHLFAHLVFYSSHNHPLAYLILGHDDNRDDAGIVLARHELNALCDRLKYLRQQHRDDPKRRFFALDRDLDTLHLHLARINNNTSTPPPPPR